jgi:hypothetical protein
MSGQSFNFSRSCFFLLHFQQASLIDLNSWSHSEQSFRVGAAKMAHPIIPYLGELVKRHIMSEKLVTKRFAKDIGVPYMVVYRLTSAKHKLKNVSFFHAKKLLKHIEPQTYLATLGQHYPAETKDLLEKGPEAEDSSDELYELADFAFSDFDRYRVYSVATEVLGAERKDVLNEAGQPGLRELDELLQRKIIEQKDDGTFKSNIAEANFWDTDLLAKVGEHNIQFYAKANPGSYMRNWVAGLNDEGMKKYYEAHAKLADTLQEIEKNESLKGRQVMCSTIVVSPINFKQDEIEG